MDEDWKLSALGMMTTCLTNALQVTLGELAKYHFGKDGPWLDALHSEFVAAVKNSRTEGLSDKEDVHAMEAAIAMVETVVAETRQKLSPRTS